MSKPIWFPTRYYCAHCPLDPRADSWLNVYQVKQHVYAEHKEDSPEEGVDFFQGWQASKKAKAREIVANSYSGHSGFADPNYGIEDFLVDAGFDAPFEPPVPSQKKEGEGGKK